MKQPCLTATLFLFLAAACSENNNNTYRIQGEIEGLQNDSVVLYLSNTDSLGKRLAPDTLIAIAKNNRFVLDGEITQSKNVSATLGGSGGRQHFSFFLEPGTITIKGNRDSSEYITVSGTASNDDHTQLNREQRAIYDAIKPLQQRLRENPSITAEEKQAVYDSISRLQDAARAGQLAFIKTHPTSLVSALRLYVLQDHLPLELQDSLYNSLAKPVQQNGFGLIVAGKLKAKKRTATGNMAPDFTKNDVNGNPVSLSSFRGKYVLLDFWASWCVPCRAENPYLVKVYKKYKDKGFAIVSISMDDKEDRWKEAIEKDNLDWTHLSDLSAFDNKAAKLYGVQPIPDNFLIDPSGKIIAKQLRGEQLENTLANLIP